MQYWHDNDPFDERLSTYTQFPNAIDVFQESIFSRGSSPLFEYQKGNGWSYILIELDIPKIVNKVSIICEQDGKTLSGGNKKGCKDLYVYVLGAEYDKTKKLKDQYSETKTYCGGI